MSFKLPEQTAELLDSYRAEVRAEMLEEVLAIVNGVPTPPEAGFDGHWFTFARNRVALRLKELLS